VITGLEERERCNLFKVVPLNALSFESASRAATKMLMGFEEGFTIGRSWTHRFI
jgi:hypothetical protein